MQLIKDSHDSFLYGDVCYRPHSHRLLSDRFPWLRFLRRALREPRLFCYQHLISGNTVLAMWTYQSPSKRVRLFHEVQILDKEPSAVWPFLISPEVMQVMVKPMEDSWKLQKERLKRKQYAKDLLVSDALQERKEVCAYLRHAGLLEEAALIEEGRTSWEPSCTNPDEHAEFVRQFRKNVSYHYGS